jgi:hypothetical protein
LIFQSQVSSLPAVSSRDEFSARCSGSGSAAVDLFYPVPSFLRPILPWLSRSGVDFATRYPLDFSLSCASAQPGVFLSRRGFVAPGFLSALSDFLRVGLVDSRSEEVRGQISISRPEFFLRRVQLLDSVSHINYCEILTKIYNTCPFIYENK